ILPRYKKIFSEAKRKGAKVRLHTDGYVMNIVEDIVSSGVDILNIQENINRLEEIKNVLKGKVAIDIDVDRQRLLPFGTPKEIDIRVKKIIQELGFKRGGLLFTAEILQDVPLSNIEALLNALEKHSKLHLECS
ncbi:MAG: uroporphyrinogen decarboxylase family protein, partial [Thermofilaceae archaeon]